MEIAAKFLEVRADGFFLPMLAVGFYPVKNDLTSRETWIINRAGRSGKHTQVILFNLISGLSSWNPESWTERETTIVHVHLLENWLDVKSGDVIDINYLLKERKTVRISEQFEPPKKPYMIKDEGAFK